jgi:hypothetical protein
MSAYSLEESALKRMDEAANQKLEILDISFSGLNAIPRAELDLTSVRFLRLGRYARFDPNLPGWRRFARSVHVKTPLSSDFDLRNIDQFPNLKTLDLSFINVRDFSPLQSLRQLRNLALSDAGLSDIASLAAATDELSALHLGFNPGISDASPLKHFSNIEYLDLHGCTGLKSLELTGTSKLKALDVRRTGFTLDPAVLDRCPHLYLLRASALLGCPENLLGGENILQEVSAWWQDLKLGESNKRQFKLMVLGNNLPDLSLSIFLRLNVEIA